MAVASMAVDAATEILMPASEDEAIAAFGDGTDVVVVGGGTIVVPDMTYRRLQPSKALMLGRAGLSGISEGRIARHDRRDDAGAGPRRNGTPRSGRARATSPISRSARREPSAGTSARAKATRRLGATCRARSSPSARPRAPQQAATSPRSRSRTSSPKRGERLLLSVSFDEPAARGVRRARPTPHARLHGTRGVGCTRDGRDTPPRGDRSGFVGLVSHRPRLRPKTRLPRARPRSRTSRRTTTPSPLPGIARRCSRCSYAASSPS